MRAQTKVGALWAAVWCVCLFLPVWATAHDPHSFFPRWLILAIGWLPLVMLVEAIPLVALQPWKLFEGIQVGWLANIALLTVVARLIVGKSSKFGDKALAALIAACATNALFFREMPSDNGSSPLIAFGIGYYLWFAVMFSAAAMLILPHLPMSERKKPRDSIT